MLCGSSRSGSCLIFYRSESSSKPQLAQFLSLIDVGHRCDLDAERVVISHALQTADQPAIFDFALPDAHLQLVLLRVAQVDVEDILHNLVRCSCCGTGPQ